MSNENMENFDKDLALKSLEKSLDEREFYSVGYQKSLAIMILTVCTFAFSLTYFLYAFFVYQPPVSYLVLNEDGRMLEEKPLLSKHMTDEDIVKWSNTAMKDILSWNHVDFPTHGIVVDKYFFAKEAPKFMSIFNDLYLQQTVKAQKAIVKPQFIKPLEITKEGKYGSKRKAFIIEGSLLLKIIGKETTKAEKYNLKIIVARENFSKQKDGLAIVSVELLKGK